jgi:hypothetical protein
MTLVILLVDTASVFRSAICPSLRDLVAAALSNSAFLMQDEPVTSTIVGVHAGKMQY